MSIQVAPPDHPAGTTWVWDDGSGVVLKAEGKAQEEMEQRKAEQKEEVWGMHEIETYSVALACVFVLCDLF